LLLKVPVTGGLRLEGAYDFELLDEIGGKACAEEGDRMQYWIGLNDLDGLAHDPLTKQAIAAAALDAIGRLDDADTILITRVVADGKNGVRVCASVIGRAVRLTKAVPAAATGVGSGSSAPQAETSTPVTNLARP
jgi:hypothetical protein